MTSAIFEQAVSQTVVQSVFFFNVLVGVHLIGGGTAYPLVKGILSWNCRALMLNALIFFII